MFMIKIPKLGDLRLDSNITATIYILCLFIDKATLELYHLGCKLSFSHSISF